MWFTTVPVNLRSSPRARASFADARPLAEPYSRKADVSVRIGARDGLS
jgi:hypothetical protein